MLDDNRNVGLDYACIIGSSRYRLGVFQIVKSQMFCPVRRQDDPIRADRFSIREIDRNFHMGIPARSVEQTSRFVAGHLRFRPVTEFWNVAFSNCPTFVTDWIFQFAPPCSVGSCLTSRTRLEG